MDCVSPGQRASLGSEERRAGRRWGGPFSKVIDPFFSPRVLLFSCFHQRVLSLGAHEATPVFQGVRSLEEEVSRLTVYRHRSSHCRLLREGGWKQTPVLCQAPLQVLPDMSVQLLSIWGVEAKNELVRK